MENSKELLKLVIEEAVNLKNNASLQELSNLNFNTLNPSYSNECIYGQMTGDCFGKRATYLIEKSCELVIEDNIRLGHNLISDTVEPKGVSRYLYFSPIEEFVYTVYNRTNGNNERLVDFLKGKTDKLELSL